MSQTFRLAEIDEIIQRDGRVTVEGLAERFGVTLQTIRRDLAELDESGRVQRVHGGAIRPSGTSNIRYEARRQMNAAGKAAIARACAARVPDGSALFLGLGTSTEAVARELVARRRLMVVTNNMNVANILAAGPDCEVIVTGGSLRPSDGGLVGALASGTIRQFRFDVSVIGCSALDEAGDLLDYDIEEAGVNRTILGQSRRSVLVADRTKLHRSAPVRIASLADLDCVVSDAPLPPSLAAACADWRTEIVIAAAGPAQRDAEGPSAGG